MIPNTKDNLTDVAGRLQDMSSQPAGSLHTNPANEGTATNNDGRVVTLGNGEFTKK